MSEDALGLIAAALGPEQYADWVRTCDFLDRGNEYECPVCDHRLAHHDGIRRCHYGWTSWDSGGCECGRSPE